MKKALVIILLSLGSLVAHCQASYIVEQIGRNQNHIVQSLGAFVGDDRAESQAFDITFMPGSHGTEGVLIVNTADYRCTFKMEPKDDICTSIILDIRSQLFQREFDALFATYKTVEDDEGDKMMSFGDKQLIIAEKASTTSRFRTFTIKEME